MTKRILGALALMLFLGGALTVILPADTSWAEGEDGVSSGSSSDDGNSADSRISRSGDSTAD